MLQHSNFKKYWNARALAAIYDLRSLSCAALQIVTVINNIRSENKMTKCAYFTSLMYKIRVIRIVQLHTCQSSPAVCVLYCVAGHVAGEIKTTVDVQFSTENQPCTTSIAQNRQETTSALATWRYDLHVCTTQKLDPVIFCRKNSRSV